MTPELSRMLFPKILPHLIRIHMTNLVLPFAVAQTVTSSYLSTLKAVLTPGSAS